MSKNLETIKSPLMVAIAKMLEAEVVVARFEDALTVPGLIEVQVPDMDLFNTAITLLGFPKDNTLEFYDPNNPEWYDHPDCFCRDWLSEKWIEVTDGKIEVPEYIEWLQHEYQAWQAANQKK